MNLSVAREFHNEKDELDRVFKSTLGTWRNSTHIYYEEIKQDATWNILPGVIYAAYYLLGCENSFTNYANIFRTAYFAHYIHTRVKDAEEGQVYNQEMQFCILIGDYFFGRLLKLLVKADNREILMPFAGMICSMNEGMIIKHSGDAEYKYVIEKTKAVIYATAFLSAAILAGKDAPFKELYRKLGFNIGMMIELSNGIDQQGRIMEYLYATEKIFKQIGEKNRGRSNLVEKIISEARNSLLVSEAAVV